MKKLALMGGVAMFLLLVSPMCVLATTDTVGDRSDASGWGTGNYRCSPITATANGQLQSIAVDLASAPTGVEIGIWDNSTLVLLAQGGNQSGVVGWNTANLTNVSIVSGTTYCVGGAVGSSISMYDKPIGFSLQGDHLSDGNLPNPFVIAAAPGWTMAARMTYAPIVKADTSIELTFNGTAGNRNYTQYEIANITAALNVTAPITINSTYAPFSNQSGASPLEYMLNLTNTTDQMPVTAYFYGNGTLNLANITRYFNVTAAGAPTTTTTTTIPTAGLNGTTYQYSCSGNYSIEMKNVSGSATYVNLFCPYGCSDSNAPNFYTGRVPQGDVCNADMFFIYLAAIVGLIVLLSILIWFRVI